MSTRIDVTCAALGLLSVLSNCRDFGDDSPSIARAMGGVSGTSGGHAGDAVAMSSGAPSGESGAGAQGAPESVAGSGGKFGGGSGGSLGSAGDTAGAEAAESAGNTQVAGSGGEAQVAGSPGGTQPGGGGSAPAVGGADGWQPTFIPDCTPDNLPQLLMNRARAAGVALTANAGNHLQIFAARLGDNAIGQLFGKTETGWSPWVCSGSVPQPRRLIGSNLSNGMIQIFVTSGDGKLFWETEYDGGWTSYASFNVPAADSFVTDLAVSATLNLRDHIYILDRGRVFFRYKQSDEPYGSYGRWIDAAASPGSSVLSAGALPGGRQVVFALDQAGAAVQMDQVSGALGASFGEWHSVGSSPPSGLVDIECGRTLDGNMILFAVRSAGNILSCAANSEGVFGEWRAWDGPVFSGSAAAIALAGPAGQGKPALLLVTTSDGHIQGSEGLDGSWAPWISFL